MTNYPYVLFNKPPLQLRLIGARGGRAFGRNQRARRARIALMPTTPPTAALSAAPGPTTAQAIALLDAQFPWLRRAEKRLSPKRQIPGVRTLTQVDRKPPGREEATSVGF
jgi:hypothetical protein